MFRADPSYTFIVSTVKGGKITRTYCKGRIERDIAINNYIRQGLKVTVTDLHCVCAHVQIENIYDQPEQK